MLVVPCLLSHPMQAVSRQSLKEGAQMGRLCQSRKRSTSTDERGCAPQVYGYQSLKEGTQAEQLLGGCVRRGAGLPISGPPPVVASKYFTIVRPLNLLGALGVPRVGRPWSDMAVASQCFTTSTLIAANGIYKYSCLNTRAKCLGSTNRRVLGLMPAAVQLQTHIDLQNVASVSARKGPTNGCGDQIFAQCSPGRTC